MKLYGKNMTGWFLSALVVLGVVDYVLAANHPQEPKVKVNCDKLLDEVSTIYYPNQRDDHIGNVIDGLIDGGFDLGCAARLAMAVYYPNRRDRELSKLIAAHLQIGECDEARRLSGGIYYPGMRDEKKRVILAKCLGASDQVAGSLGKANCDWLLDEVSTIYYPNQRDDYIGDAIDRLIDDGFDLRCATSLALAAYYPNRRDRELSKLIAVHLQIGECDEARRLSGVMYYPGKRNEQIKKIRTKCDGR